MSYYGAPDYETHRQWAAEGPFCPLTGNPCGTDTWALHDPPNCKCGQWMRRYTIRRTVSAGNGCVSPNGLSRTWREFKQSQGET